MANGHASENTISIFGGPGLKTPPKSFTSEVALAHNELRSETEEGSKEESITIPLSIQEAALEELGKPLSTLVPTQNGLSIYTVKKGDTLSGIAAEFGISVKTISEANPNVKRGIIYPGQQLKLLPVVGVTHVIQDGETLELIAGLYNVDKEEILAMNSNISLGLAPVDETIIIPGATARKTITAASRLPDLRNYFKVPATGWNQGELHSKNAIDIANRCGTPIYAAAEGLVINVNNAGNWNQGYGNDITIDHPNGTKTHYAHTQKNFVAKGDYVEKGQLIAEMGQTGKATGCHLHFEVEGAKNFLAK